MQIALKNYRFLYLTKLAADKRCFLIKHVFFKSRQFQLFYKHETIDP